MKPRPATRTVSTKGRLAVAVLAVLSVPFFLWISPGEVTITVLNTTTPPYTLKNDVSVSAHAIHTPQPLERRTITGVDVLLQQPAGPAMGILFVAHGCTRSHTDWWHSTSTTVCPDCIGMPEETAIVDMALQEFGFVVLATSSVNRETKCWTKEDGPRVAAVLQQVWKEFHNLPILLFGCSSGGGFVKGFLLQQLNKMRVPIMGFIAQIAASQLPPIEDDDPPIAVYISQSRDTKKDKGNAKSVTILQSKGVAAKHIRLEPLAIASDYFHQRIESISLQKSQQLVAALEKNKFLDTEGFLREDPSESQWQRILRPLIPESQDTFVPPMSPIMEVLKVAWARHGMARDGVREAIQFILEEHIQKRISKA